MPVCLISHDSVFVGKIILTLLNGEKVMKTLFMNTDGLKYEKETNDKFNQRLDNENINSSTFNFKEEKIDAVYFIMMLDKKNAINKHTRGLVPQNS